MRAARMSLLAHSLHIFRLQNKVTYRRQAHAHKAQAA